MSLNGRYTIKDITGRLGESAEQLTEVERKHFTNIENGPMKSNKKRFEEILSMFFDPSTIFVPLCHSIFLETK